MTPNDWSWSSVSLRSRMLLGRFAKIKLNCWVSTKTFSKLGFRNLFKCSFARQASELENSGFQKLGPQFEGKMEAGGRDGVDHDEPGETETSESEGLENSVEELERDHLGPDVSMKSRQTLGSSLGPSVLGSWEGNAARTGVTTRSQARASNKDDSEATRAPPKATKDNYNAATRAPRKAVKFASLPTSSLKVAVCCLWK